MRRALREALPALSAIYGLTPDLIDDMPYGEIDAYLEQLPKWAQLISGREGTSG